MLRIERDRLDPLDPLHRIRERQAALAALSSGDGDAASKNESVEQFLVKLRELWREGEARPTHQTKESPPRSWWTREDPFEGVWSEILVWLQEDPEATAKVLLERLQRERPGRFPDSHLLATQSNIIGN